jgi:hypothetical protein
VNVLSASRRLLQERLGEAKFGPLAAPTPVDLLLVVGGEDEEDEGAVEFLDSSLALH